MKTAWLCVFISSLCLVVAGQASYPTSKVSFCNVTGKWHTEHGSLLKLSSDGQVVRGVYQTALESVHGAAGPNREGKVLGVIGEGPQPTIAFSVLWAKGSCATWIGQCFILEGGGQVLKTLWMLRSVAESSYDNWESTRLGEDQFIFVGTGSLNSISGFA
ncbi:avidin [Trichomycterus rosablanca]|uniref:avidin n=1 Tax=Trichomycterus rosablanca TaxID=2290929 RepID=UPI002F356908